MMGRRLRPGPASIEGLAWLARVGPAPLDAWRCAMGWSEVAARSHARRLEREGWLERLPMTRGHGSLFVPTRTGVRVAGVPVRAPSPPGPTWWAHLCACAWTAAWLCVRGREMLGSREVLEDPWWSGEASWHDAKGFQRRGHRPDLVVTLSAGDAPIEVELAQKSTERLRAILGLHGTWWRTRKSIGVIYVCADEEGCERIRAVGSRVGLYEHGGGLAILLLETVKTGAVAAVQLARANPEAARLPPGTQLALFGG